MTRAALAVLLLCATASAGTIEITFSGLLVDWTGKTGYPCELPYPTPCIITVRIDEDATDSDPSSTRGVYTSSNSSITLEMDGQLSETHQGATVEVLSGHNGLWGFFVRNKNNCNAYGVYRPSSQGIYAFFTSVDSMLAPAIVPNDDLANIVSASGHTIFDDGTHGYHNGVYGYPQTVVHAEVDNEFTPYHAEYVP